MSALGDIIASMIAEDGPISLEQYMALALGDPRHGYYMTRDPLGAKGDFITAPEISQMFGELIGVWCADYWTRMGEPARVHLVELGPGRGTLMRDALRAARVLPACVNALDVHLVDTSPVLRDSQRATLASAGVAISWHASFDEVPPGPLIVIANEFFDALPARHYVRTRDGWRGRVVGLTRDGRLGFGAGPDVEPTLRVEAPDGAIIEINPIAQRVMGAIAARIEAHGGAVLAIDYGYVTTSLGETLQAMRGHAYVNPLDEPGEADLTTHVDFAALGRAARAAGAATFGPVTQGQLLERLGIFDRARSLARGADAPRIRAIESELKRLIATNDGISPVHGKVSGMGGLFKALAVTQTGGPIPAGFEEGASAP